MRAHGIAILEIGHGARDREDAAMRARGKPEARGGFFEEHPRFAIEVRRVFRAAAVEARVGHSLAPHLPLPRLRDAIANGRGGFARRRRQCRE